MRRAFPCSPSLVCTPVLGAGPRELGLRAECPGHSGSQAASLCKEGIFCQDAELRVSTEQSWASQNADAAVASLMALGSHPLLAQHSLPATQERLCRKGRRGGLGPPPKVTVRRITHGLESQWGVGGRKHGLRQLILFLRDLALCRKCEDSLLPRFPSNSHPESIPVKEEHVL